MYAMTESLITYDDFTNVDLRVGRIVQVEDFPEARKPAWKLTIDFGPELGMRKSSAQIKDLYTKEALEGRLVIACVNLPPKKIGPMMSECLTCGVPDVQGRVVLLALEQQDIPLGVKVF